MGIVDTYFLLTSIFGWRTVSKLQENIVIFTTIEKYIVVKFIISFMIGGFIAPFYIGQFIYNNFIINNKSTSNNLTEKCNEKDDENA